MEIILKKDVENLGLKDDIVEVKNGYARNYLIPQGFAVLATPSAKKVHAETLKQRAHREAKLIEDAKAKAEELQQVNIKLIVKSADGVKLFGSVNNSHIQEELAKQGFEIDKGRISIDGRNIKRVGNYVAHIRLHREVTTDVPFTIEADPDSIIKKHKAKKAEEEAEAAAEATPQEENIFEKKESIDEVLDMLGGKKTKEPEEGSVQDEPTAEASEENSGGNSGDSVEQEN